MKRFFSGFLAGALIFSVIGVFAASYVANTVSFKVLVNGNEFVSDPPPLEVEGRTYLPLRAMGDVLGVPVNWNEELQQAEVGGVAPSAPAASGSYSRTNPAPISTAQQIDVDNFMGDYSCAVRVLEVVRGEKALDMIKKANSFNSDPDAGYEYIVANIALSVLSVEDDKAYDINQFEFKAYSSNSEEYAAKFVVAPKPALDGSLFAGGNATGYLVFHVKKSDTAPKLVYGQKYDGSGGIWFALY